MSKPELQTLSRRILSHVVGALALSWVIASCGTVWVASHFLQRAYDHGLVEDAILVGERVVIDPEARTGLRLKLTPDELRALLFDTTESTYFSVHTQSGDFVAGHRGLTDIARIRSADAPLPLFVEQEIADGRVRATTILREEPVPIYVTVGQTTRGRDATLVQLVAATMLPLGILLVILVFGIRRLVNSDLGPLVRLEQELLRRGPRDLAPVHIQSKVLDFVRLGDSFNTLLATIRRAVAAQREFSGNIAHELRTPLSGIRALAEFGLRDASPAAMRQQLEAIVRTQDRASRLVDQLLALAFADEVSGSLKLEPVRLDVLVREAMLRWMPRADSRGVDLGASGLDEPHTVLANVALVEGIINNLVDNALVHAFSDEPPDGGAQITVSLVESTDSRDGRGRVELIVSDNGSGLPDSSRAEVLQRWRRSSREPMLREGAGLGLAIVSEYARLLEAQLSLDAGPGGRGLIAKLAFSPI